MVLHKIFENEHNYNHIFVLFEYLKIIMINTVILRKFWNNVLNEYTFFIKKLRLF